MKKAMAVLLLLTILTSGAASAESATGAVLDEGFEKNWVTLEKAPFEKPDPETCRIAAPPEEAWGIIQGIRTESQGEEAETEIIPIDEAMIRNLLAEGEIVILSYAPDGKHGVGYIGTENAALPVAVSEDSIAVVYPSRSRGVEDIYGMAERYYLRRWLKPGNNSYLLGTGRSGMAWSPDGRYCCAINGELIRNERNLKDGGMPAIVDTQTGEMFLLDAYGKNYLKEDGGVLTTGFFSSDGQYFYGVFIGAKYPSETEDRGYVLIRYSLATYEAERIMDLDTDVQSAAMLPDGRILMLSVRRGRDDPLELAVIRDGEYTERQAVPLTEEAVTCELAVSPASGSAMLLTMTSGNSSAARRSVTDAGAVTPVAVSVYAVSSVSPEKPLAESLETGWVVRGRIYIQRLEGVDAEHLSSITALQEYLLPPGGTAVDFLTGKAEAPWKIWEAELSPDGRYAALLVSVNRGDTPDGRIKIFLQIVRLSDMKMLTAAGFILDLEEVNRNYMLTRASETGSILNWSEAGIIFCAGEPELWKIR